MSEAPKLARLGRYKLLRPLGAGGMAELFLARADGIEGFSKLVALKRILPHKARNERFVRMFLNEARLVASLDHPNIAQVYDIGQEDGEYFFAMEYVHGPDLGRILRTVPQRRLQLENVLHIAIGLCGGLHRAHSARGEDGRSLEIVHRDVSPSNVLVSYQGAVKLVDFGVAKASTIVSETHEGVVKGKYGYMSPEQCLGEPLTRQSDVFNVGILLWEMTVGRRLYKVNGDLVTLQRIVYADAPPPSRYVANYPPALERIVMRALARDPAKRYQTAEQLQIDLETFALDHRIPVSSVSMALEMRTLFRERVEAWQHAQEAGRSLADHLAEISSDHVASSDHVVSSDEHDELDIVLGELSTNVIGEPSEVAIPTHAERPANRTAPPSARSATNLPTAVNAPATSAPVASAAVTSVAARGASRRGTLPWLIGLGVLVGLGCAAAVTFLPDPSIDLPEASSTTPVALIAKPPVAADSPADHPADVLATEDPVEAETAEPETAEPETAEPAGTANPAVPRRSPARKGERPKPRAKIAVPSPPATVRDATSEPTPAPPNPISTAEPAKPTPRPELDKLPDITNGVRPGTVDPAGVRAVARAHLGDIESCVSRARMENRDLSGRVVIRIDVAPSGKVTNATIASSTGAPSSLASCIAKSVTGWTFPAPAGGVAGAFTYPFAF